MAADLPAAGGFVMAIAPDPTKSTETTDATASVTGAS
jgi:hypothetical protein